MKKSFHLLGLLNTRLSHHSIPLCMYLFSVLCNSYLKKTDVLEKVKEAPSKLPGQYLSHCDGSYYQENQLLSEEGQKLGDMEEIIDKSYI